MSNTLINCDLSQAELRVMALESGDDWMIAALQEDQGDFFDTHMMPVCFPDIIESYGSVDLYKSQRPVAHKEARTKVKGIQYGLAFGRQKFAISKALGLTGAQAGAIIDNYLNTAYQFAQWRIDIQEAAVNPSKRDLLVNKFGRRFQSEIITPSNFEKVQREALAFIPQSTSSDICLSTAIRIAPTLKEAGYQIINLVHDAIMIEGDEAEADVVGRYVAEQLRETGKMVYGTTVPFLSDYSIGASWADLT